MTKIDNLLSEHAIYHGKYCSAQGDNAQGCNHPPESIGISVMPDGQDTKYNTANQAKAYKCERDGLDDSGVKEPFVTYFHGYLVLKIAALL
jgi:hypothetical protein